MTGNPTDGRTDQLIRARLREIGLSQADLATLLDAAFQPSVKNGDRPAGLDTGRLAQLAAALGLKAAQETPASAESQRSQPSLLELRLLRAFCELRDPRAQRMLVYLAEQLATCTRPRPGDAG
jgi:hypothetical protein